MPRLQNYIRKTLAIPNDPQYPPQWHYPLINLPQSWEVTTGSNTVIVAVIDTGVLLNHPDLENRLTSDGYDFISDRARARDGDGIDPDPDDQFGHGLIDAFGALVEAQNLAGGGVAPLTLIVNPTVLNFGPQSTTSLRVEKAGGNPGDQLSVTAVSAVVPWLIVTVEPK